MFLQKLFCSLTTNVQILASFALSGKLFAVSLRTSFWHWNSPVQICVTIFHLANVGTLLKNPDAVICPAMLQWPNFVRAPSLYLVHHLFIECREEPVSMGSCSSLLTWPSVFNVHGIWVVYVFPSTVIIIQFVVFKSVSNFNRKPRCPTLLNFLIYTKSKTLIKILLAPLNLISKCKNWKGFQKCWPYNSRKRSAPCY